MIYQYDSDSHPSVVREENVESDFIEKLRSLKYTDRPDIRDRAALEANFRQEFEALNRVRLADGEFARLLDEIVTADVFTAAKTLRSITSFTPRRRHTAELHLGQHQGLVKKTFEVVSQLRINTDTVGRSGEVVRT